MGFNRLVAALAIIGVFIVGFVVLVLLTAPIIARELAYFLDNLPIYFGQLKTLTSDPGRPWLRKIVGEGLASAEQSIGELATLGVDWFGSVVRSVWTGGRALISVFSLAIVTPVVAGYLIYDWDSMLAAVDNWTPPPRRPTVRALAREIDDTIGGFVRGQGTLCLILCVYYAVALALAGLNHSLLIGVAAGLISFVPYLGSITGLAVATCVAIAQFWPNWSVDRRRAHHLRRRPGHRGLRAVALSGRPARQFASGVDDLRAVRVRICVRVRRASARGAARGRMPRASAFRAGAILRKPALCRPTRYAAPDAVAARGTAAFDQERPDEASSLRRRRFPWCSATTAARRSRPRRRPPATEAAPTARARRSRAPRTPG